VIQYVIPGNDDAIRSGNLLCRVIADAVEEGRFIASRRGNGSSPAVERTEDDEARVAAEQAEARRQALLAQQERDARLASGGAPPAPAPAEPAVTEAPEPAVTEAPATAAAVAEAVTAGDAPEPVAPGAAEGDLAVAPAAEEPAPPVQPEA
jgi:small subunit ribosomal protein S2